MEHLVGLQYRMGPGHVGLQHGVAALLWLLLPGRCPSFIYYLLHTYLADVPVTLDARVGSRVIVTARASMVAVVTLDAWLERVRVDGW